MPVDSLVIYKGWFRTQCRADGRPSFDRIRAHHYIDVLENLAGSDAAAAVRGLDQVVTRLAAVFATECVDEGEGLSELFCFDQEAGAIDVPLCG